MARRGPIPVESIQGRRISNRSGATSNKSKVGRLIACSRQLQKETISANANPSRIGEFKKAHTLARTMHCVQCLAPIQQVF